MKRYKVTAYPNWEDWVTEVEADSPEEAREIGEEKANMNCCFLVTDKDVEEIDEGKEK